MEKEKKSYNLVIGIVALIVIILLIAIIGYFVSKPKPLMIQGEAEASEYRVSGKVPGRIEELYVKDGDPPHEPHGAISSALSTAALLEVEYLKNKYREE